jgi:hypothetical protein
MSTIPALLMEPGPEAEWALMDPRSVAGKVARAREEGYIHLTPFQRQFALEFVLSGATLKKIARVMELPRPTVQRMYNDPVVRAYISDLQKEVAAQRIINDQWVENQILQQMPKLLGEEPVDIVTSKGCHVKRKKYHAAELVSLFKHFGGGQEAKQAGAGGVNVQINFGDILSQPPTVTINGESE